MAELGVIEGFFGRDWGWPARAGLMPWLAGQGFSFYLYAPKSDRALRMEWRRPWDAPVRAELHALRDAARAAGIAFGVGVSPYELDPDDFAAERVLLDAKLDAIAALEPDLLGLLFDDAPGGVPDLAARHLAIAEAVLARGVAPRTIVCPGYYSDDPILTEVFGAPPPRYLEDLAAGLPEEVDLFWTGPKVISERYPADHLAEVTRRIGRRPVLWDNALSNDGRARAPFLPLGPGALGPDLPAQVAGVAVNPMNQPHLARIALSRAAAAWHGRLDPGFAEAGVLAPLIAEIAEAMTRTGYDALGDAGRAALRARVEPHAALPMAAEILDWLDGGYVFDPACLT